MLVPIDKVLPYLAAFAGITAASKFSAAVPRSDDGQWITTWTAMPQLTEPANLPAAPYVCHEPLQPGPADRVQEREQCGVRELDPTSDPAHVYWRQSDPNQSIECLRWLRSANHWNDNRLALQRLSGRQRYPTRDSANGDILRGRINSRSKRRVSCLRPP
jgi:hypothetical protein